MLCRGGTSGGLTYDGKEKTIEISPSNILPADGGVTASYTVREGGSILNADEYTIDFEITGDDLGNSFTLEVTEADEPVDPDEPTDPDEPVDPETPAEPSEPSGFPGWAIAVIVCGSLLVIAAVIAIGVVAKKKGKKGDAEGR